MNNIENLSALFEVFKPSLNLLNKDSRFFENEDLQGWTDGYIADLTNLNKEQVKALAITKKAQVEQRRPQVKQLIWEESKENPSHEVEKVEYSLKDRAAILYNSTEKVAVNPKFLGYFEKAYQTMGGINKLIFTNPLKPIKVYCGDTLVGLVMPIRIDRA